MKNNLKIEGTISVVLMVLAVVLLNPFNLWMPNMLHMLMLTFTFATFAFFAIYILQEKVQDERELAHRMLSGRIAFLIGSAVLTTGIVIESFQDVVDVWLVIALTTMVLSKLLTRIYSDWWQ